MPNAKQDDQQVEPVDRAQEAADVHSRSSERDPGPPHGGRGPAQGSSAEFGASNRTQVLIRPPSAPSAVVTAAIAPSTSASVSVRSGAWKTSRQARLFSSAARGVPR